jgi:hypothetical protein
MKYAGCLSVAFVCSGALASEPGSPIDCSDWVFVQPGLHSSVFIAPPSNSNLGTELWSRGDSLTVDNEGFLLVVHRVDGVAGTQARYEINRKNPAGEQLLGYVIEERGAPSGYIDRISVNGAQNGNEWFSFDAVHGRLLVTLRSECVGACPHPSVYGGGQWTAAIEGFTTLFEVVESYEPAAPALGFRVPVRPEGMAGANHFDTFWGRLTKPLDFIQAHPLACNYPSAAPRVGDYLTVSDTVPTPAPGQGVYYVTSATYQGATRYGRKTNNGHLTGRDPALLPACTTP